jgi:hypothetical protein
MVAYTAMLNLSVTDVPEAVSALLERLKSDNGFIVRETERTVAARVPVANMDSFISYAKTLGTVERETKTGTDITDQYRDDVMRLSNLETVRDRYLELLDWADSVNDILRIERELERITTAIEVLRGRIQHAETSVAYSSVTVEFKEWVRPIRPGPLSWVFYGVCRGLWWLFVW